MKSYDAELERIRQETQRLLAEALQHARTSSNPVLAELADEVSSGRMTPFEALTSSAYRDLLEARLERAVEYLKADEDERRLLEDDPDFRPPAPTEADGHTAEPEEVDGEFEDFSIGRRRR